MDELAQELAAMRDEVVPAWSESRSDRLYAGVGRLRQRRRARKIAASGFVAVAAVCCGAFYLRDVETRDAKAEIASAPRGLGTDDNSSAPPQAAGVTPSAASATAGAAAKPELASAKRMLPRLADGSQVHLLSTDADVAVEHDEARRVELRMTAGIARFDVVPNKDRQFTVRAGSVEVSVVGTIFDVERTPERVRVAVTRGKVRVRSAGGTMLVQAGDSVWFAQTKSDAHESSNSAAFDNDDDTSEPRSGRVQNAPTPSKNHGSRALRRNTVARDEAPPWRSLSQSGDYEAAYQLLAEGTVVEDDSEALLDAADAARLSGHPEAALQYLRSVLSRHRSSPVAPLAAFTLGRVLLERLGQPSEAAAAFATSRDLSPDGSLAQDALAREVEAWSKAGHPQEAYQRARLYVGSYPEGRRLRAVQLYGGLR